MNYRRLPLRKVSMAIFAFVVCLVLIVCLRAQSENKKTQASTSKCRPAVIPVETEGPPKIYVDSPLAAPLARGVAVIEYCSENLHIVPVFGAKALQVTPRIGHLHVRVDDAAWVWAEASGNPIILMGLAPGPHKVTVELVNANHQPLDKGVVTFDIPKPLAAGISDEKNLDIADPRRAATQTIPTHHH